jgi:hypothetical protein
MASTATMPAILFPERPVSKPSTPESGFLREASAIGRLEAQFPGGVSRVSSQSDEALLLRL